VVDREFGKFLQDASDLLLAADAERKIQVSLDSMLFVEVGATGTNEKYLRH